MSIEEATHLLNVNCQLVHFLEKDFIGRKKVLQVLRD